MGRFYCELPHLLGHCMAVHVDHALSSEDFVLQIDSHRLIVVVPQCTPRLLLALLFALLHVRLERIDQCIQILLTLRMLQAGNLRLRRLCLPHSCNLCALLLLQLARGADLFAQLELLLDEVLGFLFGSLREGCMTLSRLVV